MAIGGVTKAASMRVTCAVGAVVAFAGMVLAGSRGAYVAFVLTAVLWPFMCLKSSRRGAWRVGLATALTGTVLFATVSWVQENTTLGQRSRRALAREDHSTEVRLELLRSGLATVRAEPLIGVGLGQFGAATGTGFYAHNEWLELAATTGVPGFLLFMGVYASAWSRLTGAAASASNPTRRYEMSMARLTLAALVVSGALFRPNFISIDTMFLLAMVVGTSYWAPDHR
jgi:O-antigen ligase